MKMISKIRVIDFSLRHSSNSSKKQVKTQSKTDARNDHLIYEL